MMGPCEVCWSISWVPIEDKDECVLVHPHDGEHIRCDHCWLHEEYMGLRDSISEPTFEDPRVEYVEVQIPVEMWQMIKKERENRASHG